MKLPWDYLMRKAIALHKIIKKKTTTKTHGAKMTDGAKNESWEARKAAYAARKAEIIRQHGNTDASDTGVHLAESLMAFVEANDLQADFEKSLVKEVDENK